MDSSRFMSNSPLKDLDMSIVGKTNNYHVNMMDYNYSNIYTKDLSSVSSTTKFVKQQIVSAASFYDGASFVCDKDVFHHNSDVCIDIWVTI